METDDEDVFSDPEDEENVVIEEPKVHNPIEENLIRHLNEIDEQIEKANKEKENLETVTKKILQKLSKKVLYFDEDDSSESETERYNEAGVPIQKRHKKKKGPRTPPLIVREIWQRVVDDKWVIGIDLQNTSLRLLEDPMLYVTIKGQKELSGFTGFWEMSETSLWINIDELSGDPGRRVATVVLDMPRFDESDTVEGYGVISYRIDDRHLQAPIKSFQLTASRAVDKSMTPRHSDDHEKSILAIKAASVEDIVSIPMADNLGAKLADFLQVNGFLEVFPDVHVSTNTETLRHCIIEVILMEDDVQLKISARSMSQLNILMHMLREKIPGVDEADKRDVLLEAAKALEREIVLRIGGQDERAIINASIFTDLLIPD